VTVAINSFADVQKFFAPIDASGAPHGNFWNQSEDPKTSYNLFVTGNVPGGSQTANPNTGAPLSILTKGDGEHSNIIYALRGTAGTFWDKNDPNSAFGQMPAGGPFYPDAQIQELSDWITAKCPFTAAAVDAKEATAYPIKQGTTTIQSFADVQKFFAPIDASGAPHGNFWNQNADPKVSYKLFVNGDVPGGSQTANPNTGAALPILSKGKGEESNIIYALRGTKGTFWDKTDPNSAFGQMPYGGPYFTDAEIQPLSDWITAGCPYSATADDA
jgi:hypothetical protein